MPSDRCLSVCLSVCPVCDDSVLWPNGWIDQDETWHAGSLGPGHTMLDGDTAPPPQRGTAPQFSAHICCGQMAEWIKMPLGMEIGLSLGDFVSDWDPAPLPKNGPCLLWPNDQMDQDSTLHGGGHRSRPHCARRGPSSPSQKRGHTPSFRPMSNVAKQLYGSRSYLVRR